MSKEVFFVYWALLGQHWTCTPPLHSLGVANELFDQLPNDHEHRASLWNSDESSAASDLAKYISKEPR
jgi:hypothetical protein